MSRTKHKAFYHECAGILAEVGKQADASKLAALQRDLNLLVQTWSVMAGRNLMNDVLRGLRGLEPSLPAAMKPKLLQATKTLEKMLAAHVVGKARYDSVVCLGYRVKVAFDSYQGKADDYDDMQTRCQDLKTAIRAAYQLVQREKHSDGKILKIFMAPEFYFRGRNGAYDFADVTGLGKGKSGIVELMEQELKDPIYKDWLFVLGTAIAASKVTRTVCQQNKAHRVQFIVDRVTGKSNPQCTVDKSHKITEATEGAQVDNIALVWKEGEVHTISKELVSSIDYVMSPAESDVVMVGKDKLPVIKHGIGAASGTPTKFQDERMGGCVFTLDGVTFGLEVCLDHAASTRSPSAGRLDHAGNIQVHLIPSAGMQIGALRTVSGGVIFNVDGSTPHVQAVGNDGSAANEVRFDLVSGGYEYELSLPGGVAKGANVNMTDLKKAHPLHTWNAPAAPKEPVKSAPSAAGPSGSVLLYGPYELPDA